MWADLYTECLLDYIRRAFNGRKVHIFDLLCDQSYVDSIKWHKLPRPQCSVFHIASPEVEDINLLPPAGIVLNALLANPDRLETLGPADRDRRRYRMSDFGAAPAHLNETNIIFESRVGNSKD